MAEQNKELIKEFKAYVDRFDKEVGVKDFGEFGTWNRQLVKKLKYDEFAKKWKEYKQLDILYTGILERGDTVNDVVLKSLRDCAAELLIVIE
jgi:hypothetical protein